MPDLPTVPELLRDPEFLQGLITDLWAMTISYRGAGDVYGRRINFNALPPKEQDRLFMDLAACKYGKIRQTKDNVSEVVSNLAIAALKRSGHGVDLGILKQFKEELPELLFGGYVASE